MSDYEMILSKLTQISEKLDGYSASSTKKQRVRKPRDPSSGPAKENPWVTFTGRVGKLFEGTDYSRGKEKQQFCSYLKTTHENAYEMSDEDILAARADWTPAAAKPKAAPAPPPVSAAVVLAEEVPEPKPKRTLSDEQKAKMAAGRKAAAEKKKAEKEAAEEVPAPVPESKGSHSFRPKGK